MNAVYILVLTATFTGAFPEYDTRTVEGWQVHVEREFLEESPEQAQATLRLLKTQLYLITRNVPHGAVTKLREVAIWVEQERLPEACMAYHPNIHWLREHGVNPKKAKSIEIINAKNFLSWCHSQPNMVVHELAHAYHDRFLGGFGNEEIAEAYHKAMEEKLYEKVLHIGGKEQKAYATTNPMAVLRGELRGVLRDERFLSVREGGTGEARPPRGGPLEAALGEVRGAGQPVR